MSHILGTISDRIKSIREESGLTQEEFAASIGIKRPNYANIEVGKQLPTLDTITAIVRIYRKSFDWLITGASVSDNYAHPNAHPNAHPIKKEGGDSYTKKVYKGVQGSEQVIDHIVDTSGLQLVPIVDISAAAGEGYLNQEFIDEEQVLRLPANMVKSGYHLCIRVKGPSMAPTFQDGGYVIIRHLAKHEWAGIKNEYVYVIVDNEGKAYIKRIRNRFSSVNTGFIVCTSDSPDKMAHPNFNLQADEIQHIWVVAWYFTAKMPNIHDTYYNRLSRLEDDFSDLIQRFEKIEKRKVDTK